MTDANPASLTDQLLAFKGLAVGLWIAAFFLGERLLPSAKVGLDKAARWWRVARNGGLFGVNAGLSVLVVVPISAWAAVAGPDWRAAVAPWWSGWLGLGLDLLLLDCLIYWWHRANHVFPFLWRFHEVHHLDETLDSTSAVRFHFGEVLLSALMRACVILAFDIPIESILVFETQVLLIAIFQHSNIRLPQGFERGLSWIIVTPSIHWIHHHAVRRDTDSNYANLFSVWDRIFGTRSPSSRWEDMPIGVEREPEKNFVTLLIRPLRLGRTED